jgi:hypothetical protein
MMVRVIVDDAAMLVPVWNGVAGRRPPKIYWEPRRLAANAIDWILVKV